MNSHPAWILIGAGLFIAVLGLLWLLGPSLPWIGKLPGDIAVERENVRFYFPLTTCILLSLLLTGIVWVIRFFSK
ncbi:DUF2905 domain-containing protein [Gimesia chilikensis]|uniref:DUF2905 domain-containing protein n=1 Tax=Gimesia chilikensis TaxID=2605989 RepID=UPI003A90ADB9